MLPVNMIARKLDGTAIPFRCAHCAEEACYYFLARWLCTKHYEAVFFYEERHDGAA